MQSRPIKFRAWDKEKMVHFTQKQWICSEYNSICWEVDEEEEKEYLGKLHLKEDYILMQYTGLKDKNGKGIYEGDIVKASYRNTPQVVEWIAKYAGFSIGGAMPERPVNSDFTDWEIIGNIYENPELLN